MAISDSAKVDLLYKKLFGVAKTDLPGNKSPSNESIASPALLRGDNVWQQATSIPGIAAASAGIVQAYTGSGAVQCSADTTSTPISSVYPSWKTNLTDWIPSEFGSTYFVQVWVDNSGAGNPTSTGTQIFDAGSGGTGEWNFDYQSGVLNFIGGTIPAALTSSKVIYVVGYRYIGAKGVNVFPAGITVGNITINGNTLTGNTGVTFGGNISGNITGNVITAQPYLTSVGNLTSLTVIGNISTDSNLVVTGNATVENLTIRSNLTVGNVTGSIFNGNITGTILTADQPYITTVGNLTSLTVVGNISGSDIALDGNLYTTNVFGNVVGTILTADQPYITTVGNLSSLTVTGNTALGNVTASSVSSAYFSGNLVTDYITSATGSITITTLGTGTVDINANTALRLPAGTTAERPAGSQGDIRVNTDTGVLEYFGGVTWIPLTYNVSDESFNGDGINDTYTLNQATTAAGIIVSINGTIQQPQVAYTVSGDQITFAEIPQSTDVINVRYIASAVTVDDNFRTIGADNIAVGTALTIVDSFDKAMYRSAKYTISSHNSVDDQLAEVLVLQGNNTVVINTTSVLNTGANTVTFSANISGNDINLLAQGTTSANNLRIQKTYFNL